MCGCVCVCGGGGGVTYVYMHIVIYCFSVRAIFSSLFYWSVDILLYNALDGICKNDEPECNFSAQR